MTVRNPTNPTCHTVTSKPDPSAARNQYEDAMIAHTNATIPHTHRRRMPRESRHRADIRFHGYGERQPDTAMASFQSWP